MIVPLPAGSAADVVARLVASGLSERLGQTVVVDNREGGSGVIGTSLLSHAKGDGYTIGMATTTTLATAPILNPNLNYNPRTDILPVSMIGYSPYVLVTNPSVPAKTVADFIALAKSKPGVITYSSEGDASLARLGAELFAGMSSIKLNQVPYKSSTQAIVDLIAGRIDSQFGILTTTYQYIREGKLNALGVTTLKRVPELPNVPTIAESGLPGYDASLWLAVVVPAKTPKDIVDRLNKEINELVNDPKTRNVLNAQAISVNLMSPPELKTLVDGDFEKWTTLAKKAGL
jgi:tripartite-type tricarboxylate transporter receptor subunit TctC